MDNYICVQKVEAVASTNHDFATWSNEGVLPEEYQTKPVINGFRVLENGGKTYWMSDTEFNAKFTKTGEMTFGEAIAVMQNGGKVTRAGWNNVEIYCEIQETDATMTEPYIYMTKNAGATVFPAGLSTESTLASDWTEVE